ncbi:MAG: ribosomal-processing cysteine protease Prp [Thermotaleaceae bacterium]
MIVVNILRDNNKHICQYSIKGHANFAEHGEDIVCASISILAQTAILALHEIAKIDVIYEISNGWLFCKLPDGLSSKEREQANIILDTLYIGVKGTQGMYESYIELHDEEV